MKQDGHDRKSRRKRLERFGGMFKNNLTCLNLLYLPFSAAQKLDARKIMKLAKTQSVIVLELISSFQPILRSSTALKTV